MKDIQKNVVDIVMSTDDSELLEDLKRRIENSFRIGDTFCEDLSYKAADKVEELQNEREYADEDY